MMVQATLLLSLLSSGFAQPPAWDDCICEYPQSGEQCGSVHGKDNISGLTCGSQTPGAGGCGKPATCPYCSQIGFPGSASCGITCNATSKIVTDEWCMKNCNANPSNCPRDRCQCNGNKVLVSASDCGRNTSYMHLTSFKIAPTNIVLGQTFTVTASVPQPAVITSDAMYEISAMDEYNIRSSMMVEGNVCKYWNFDLQNGDPANPWVPAPPYNTKIAYDGSTCAAWPSNKGNITLGIDIFLPVRIFYPDFMIKVKAPNGTELFCARVNTTTANVETTMEVLGSEIII